MMEIPHQPNLFLLLLFLFFCEEFLSLHADLHCEPLPIALPCGIKNISLAATPNQMSFVPLLIISSFTHSRAL